MKCRGCLQVIVKFFNLLLFVVGAAMVLYSFWMLKHLRDDDQDENGLIISTGRPFLQLISTSSKFGDHVTLPVPWFMYSFMVVGALVCVISFSGYVAAEAASGCCLCCYSVSMAIFLLVQGILAAIIFFDKTWEQDFPNDPTGEIHRMRKFVESNAEFCRWVSLCVVVLEVLCLLFGMILRAVIGDFRRSDDSDDDFEYVPAPRPSLRQYPQGGSSSRNWTPRVQQQKSAVSP